MPRRRRVPPSPALEPLDFAAIRAEFEIPGPFPAEVETAAGDLISSDTGPRIDATDLDLVTIDPPGSKDLDQAVGIEARDPGWRVFYAIADVGAWVDPGGPIDLEARRRTQTHYCPDLRVPLHPHALGENAASLLPDGPRPAALWTIDVGADGTTTAVDVVRALVRSRAQLTYGEVQASIDDGSVRTGLAEFPALGAALLADAFRRNAINLGLPEQEVETTADGGWTLRTRTDLAIEEWNAQVSLLTGRAAATLMAEHGVGLLRTLPEPDPAEFPRFQRVAASLGIEWPEGTHPGAVLASLDTSRPRHGAFADLCSELLRGAGYTVVSGTDGEVPGHAGVGAPYAHVTAPLRRLVDRFTTEICLALVANDPVPVWVLDSLEGLPELMTEGDRRSRKLERAVIDATEAFVLAPQIGSVFPAAVMEGGETYGTVVLDDPAVQARCDTPRLELGEEIHVRCTEADVAERRVRFERTS